MIQLEVPTQRKTSASLVSRKNILETFFSWREHSGFSSVETVILAAYSLIVAYALSKHEAWGDEAQAWLIARDSSLWNIYRHRLHYEGAPPLWHFLLHFASLAHMRYAGIGWFGAAFAVTGVYVWLRWSPFPALVRYMLPFTFFLQYQYAVIARSYVLFGLLTFALCALFYQRPRRTVWFALLAGLLANLSLQGMTTALCLMTLYLWDWRNEFGPLFFRTRRFLTSAVLFSLLAMVGVYAAIPAPDVNFAVTDQVSDSTVHRLLQKIVGESSIVPRPDVNGAKLRKAYGLAEPKKIMKSQVAGSITHAQPIDDGMRPFAWSPESWFAWESNAHPAGRGGEHQQLFETIFIVLSQMTWPIANSNVLAGEFLLLTVLWMWSRGSLRMMLPWCGLLAVGTGLWIADHHAGMTWIALLAGIWLASQRGSRRNKLLERGFVAVMAIVLALQIGWSATAIAAEGWSVYDPGPQIASILQSEDQNKRVASFGFQTVAVQPFFSSSRFYNQSTSYWQWSSNVATDLHFNEIMLGHPDVLVIAVESAGPGIMRNQWVPLSTTDSGERQSYFLNTARSLGYIETHHNCGSRFGRFSTSYYNCLIVLETPTSQKNRDNK